MIEVITQGVFVLIFALTLGDFLRHRDRQRLEVAALFGTLAVIIVLAGFTQLTGVAVPGAAIVGALLIVAQPYLLLRLVEHFRPVPPLQRWLGLGLLLVSWTIFLVAGPKLPPRETITIVVAFAYVEGYATVAFVRSAVATRGVTRRRLVAVALGSGLLAAVILLAGLTAGVPASTPIVTVLSRLLALGSAIGYYVGFAPPRWLRRAWQMSEIRPYLLGPGSRDAEQRLTAALDRVGPAAARAIGGKAALVALGRDGDTTLRLHRDPDNRKALARAGIDSVPLNAASPMLLRVWTEGRPLVSGPSEWGSQLRELVAAFGGAGSILVSPLRVDETPHGLLIVLLERASLFVHDDLELLTILAEQAALAIESSRLYLAAQAEAAKRQAMLNLSQLIADETEVAGVVERAVAGLERLLPALTWGALLPTPEGGLEVAAAGGEAADARRGRILPPGTGVTGRVLRSGQTVVLDDVRQDPDYLGILPSIRSHLAVPLRHGNDVLGVLNVESTEIGAFGPAEVATAQIVAAHTAVALGRAQLVERLRQQNAALEDASRLKSEFLANMSHELRTPLNAIIGFSELLLDSADDPATSASYLETIHNSGQHLLALINDILDLSKVEAGKMDLHLEPFAVDDVVVQAIQTVEPLARRRGIALSADAAAGELLADQGKFKQVLYNLLSNAIKFTPEGGRVAVEARRVANGVQVTVSDTGIGIAPEDHERIFQEFQQLDGAASRRHEGTGLGLALTRKLVELHGGRIWVESAPGEGSCFHALFPLRAVAVPTAPGVPVPAVAVVSGTSGPLVLIVEDDQRAANLLTLYLGRGGYRTEVAAGGQQALEKARALQPVAITLDVLLPDLDGWEVLRALKSDERTHDIPVVIASVVDDPPLGYALGAVDYFVKPIDRRALLARLARYRLGRPDDGGALRVLAVDDDPRALDLLEGMLVPAGHNVVRATGGQAGIDLARQTRPDLILLDLMMPEVTGFAVAEALHADEATRDIPILVVTAKELTDEDKAALNGRVATILRKGTFARQELLDWLDKTVRHAAPVEEASLGRA